jgi:plastocyanin
VHIHPPGVRPIGAVLIAIALALAGCGGGGAQKSAPPSSSGGGSGVTLSLPADPSQLKFDKTALSATAGTVTIVMKNPSQLQHDVAIEGNGVNEQGKVVGHGGTSTVTATLKPGSYTFFCTVDSHRQAGMEGTLTVK